MSVPPDGDRTRGGDEPAAGSGLSRRSFLGYLGVGVAGAAVGAGATAAVGAAADGDGGDDVGAAVVAFHGAHQSGIETPPPAQAEFVAFDLPPDASTATVASLLRDWTSLAAALSEGASHELDPVPTLAGEPASLTVTFGFGPRLFDVIGKTGLRPPGVADYPPFQHDELQEEWSGGDLLAQVCAEDSVSVTHASEALISAAAGRAALRWRQAGFGRTVGVAEGQTGRNLMGNKDGTGNDEPGTAAWDQTVWASAGPGVPDWYVGGTTLVVRRIRMDLEPWYAASLRTKERTIGRELESGAPLGTDDEFADVPLQAQQPDGSLQIHSSAHVRLAHPDSNSGARMFRRGWNYSDADGAGLIFVAINADSTTGFLPVQSRIAAGDDLNHFTTAIGSAAFAVPPGVAPGQYVGQTLLEA